VTNIRGAAVAYRHTTASVSRAGILHQFTGWTDLSSTHPDSESQLDVFRSPDLHFLVEAADGQEVVLAYG